MKRDKFSIIERVAVIRDDFSKTEKTAVIRDDL